MDWRELRRLFTIVGIGTICGCVNQPHTRLTPVDPDVARAEIARLLPRHITASEGWAVDIFAAFEALNLAPTSQNICAVVAVTQQESTFQVNPTVPGLPAIARREIDARATRAGIPKLLVYAALSLQSPNGKTYSERLDQARTERDLSEVFEDFIGMVPLGKRLFADWNPVRTGGPMQVSVAFAEEHAHTKPYPYRLSDTIRHEVFTRRGGLYFGIAHLFDYSVGYGDMLFRFADYNAGHYASRNAAFQNAVSVVSRTSLALDGDLLLYGKSAGNPSKTELAIRKIASRLQLDDSEIHKALEMGHQEGFEKTLLYQRVFDAAQGRRGRVLPRAVVPHIRLHSAKITRKLTTEWFADRVNGRYKQCLSR